MTIFELSRRLEEKKLEKLSKVVDNKIALIARLVYPYATGGAEIHTYYLAKELSKSNQVILISEGSVSLKFPGHFVHLNLNNAKPSIFSSISFILPALVQLSSREQNTSP